MVSEVIQSRLLLSVERPFVRREGMGAKGEVDGGVRAGKARP